MNPVSALALSAIALVTLATDAAAAPTRSEARHERRLATKLVYPDGTPRTAWEARVPTYKSVRSLRVFPGVEAVFYGDGPSLGGEIKFADEPARRRVSER